MEAGSRFVRRSEDEPRRRRLSWLNRMRVHGRDSRRNSEADVGACATHPCPPFFVPLATRGSTQDFVVGARRICSVVQEYGMSQRDAYLQMSINPGVRVHVYQMIPDMPLLYTAGVEFPKECL